MVISRAQCRAARALLNWKQADIAARSEMSKKTISDFEDGTRTPFAKNLKDIRAAFEQAGVIFYSQEGELQDGVALKWGMEDAKKAKKDAEKAAAKDDETRQAMVEFWQDNHAIWAEMPADAREALADRMGMDIGEDAFGGAAE